MKPRITAIILALVMVISTMPYAFAAKAYNRDAAVDYANAHWNDGKGLCAEFVSDCINAGGCTAWNRNVTYLLNALNGWGTLYTVAAGTTVYKDWKLNKSACNFDVAPGDLMFFYCSICANAGQRPYAHVAIITGFDSQGNIICAQHNPALNDYDTLRGFGHKNSNVDNNTHTGSVISLRIFHFDGGYSGGSSTTTPVNPQPANAVSTWTLSVSAITETSATVRTDVVCDPSRITWIGLKMGTSTSDLQAITGWPVYSVLTYCYVMCDGSEAARLSPDTKYYYQFYVIRNDGTYEYSNISFFSTKATACTAHTYDGGTITMNSTCTSNGRITYKCTTCGSLKTNDIITNGHNPVTVPGYAATCTAAGLTDGKKCSVCNEVIIAQTEIPAKGHDSMIIPGYDATCVVAGRTDGVECPVCNEVIIAQTEIPAKGHNAVLVKGYEATCTEKGLRDWAKCSVCDAVIFAQKTIPAKGHTAETIPGKAATCTAAGLTDGEKCSVCNVVIKERTIIPAKGHTAGEWTVVTEPQPGVTGREEQRCTVCSVVIAARSIFITVISGDVDKDGCVTASDARLVLRISVGLHKADSVTLSVADFNKDGAVNATDARAVLRRSVGLS